MKQCLNIEQMQHLKELGVDTSKASMALVYRNKNGDIVDWNIVDKDIHEEDIGQYNPYIRSMYGTFTLCDIFDFLPNVVISNNKYFKLCIEISCGKWCIYYYTDDTTELISKDDIYLIDSAYEMLCWVIENGYLKVKQDEGI